LPSISSYLRPKYASASSCAARDRRPTERSPSAVRTYTVPSSATRPHLDGDEAGAPLAGGVGTGCSWTVGATVAGVGGVGVGQLVVGCLRGRCLDDGSAGTSLSARRCLGRRVGGCWMRRRRLDGPRTRLRRVRRLRRGGASTSRVQRPRTRRRRVLGRRRVRCGAAGALGLAGGSRLDGLGHRSDAAASGAAAHGSAAAAGVLGLQAGRLRRARSPLGRGRGGASATVRRRGGCLGCGRGASTGSVTGSDAAAAGASATGSATAAGVWLRAGRLRRARSPDWTAAAGASATGSTGVGIAGRGEGLARGGSRRCPANIAGVGLTGSVGAAVCASAGSRQGPR
jgi:hypothetical protein